MAFLKHEKNKPTAAAKPTAPLQHTTIATRTVPTDRQTVQTGEKKMSKSAWSGLGDELAVVEPGLYSVEVSSLKEVMSKSSGEPMLVLSVRIMDDGKFQGRPVFTNFVKSSDVARQIFARFCKAIDLHVVEDEIDLEAALGRRLKVQVRNRVNEQSDEVRADIERFLPY